ncbi:unnamed protein product [Ceratitis capitata]|uniref:(Mediterranean fruit fly) hypothetical protein n=1 Tax=Ceratitis capitata TaxID=7213 RepID=A0A811VCM9_CERCA|nr:unnamed protein product [Ceratitis capitata]
MSQYCRRRKAKQAETEFLELKIKMRVYLFPHLAIFEGTTYNRSIGLLATAYILACSGSEGENK